MSFAVATPDAYDLFHRGAQVLAEMEHSGVKIDVLYLTQAIEDITVKIKELQDSLRADPVFRTWRKRYGQNTVLGSAEQLATVLFEVMKFPSPGFTKKSGGEDAKKQRHRTDESSLLSVDIPFVKDYLRLRKLTKAKSTYLENLLRETVDGYLHPTFSLHTTSTYRSSSGGEGDDDRGWDREVNFQNLPSRNPEIAEIIRRSVIPRKGHNLVEVDFGALEWKIATCFWRDEKMVEYCLDESKDIHRDMASRCYKMKKKDVDKNVRYCGKNGWVFPRLYGSYYVKIARAMWEMIDDKELKAGLGEDAIPMREHLAGKGIMELGKCKQDERYEPAPGTFEAHIKGVQEWFDRAFPTLTENKRKWLSDYKERGWFRLMTGFVVSGVYSNNFLLNSPVQGPAFHCLLWSAIKIQEEIRKRKMKSKLIAEIHDSLLGDIPVNEVQDFLHLSKRVMTEDIRKAWDWLIVPLTVEVDVVEEGETWAGKRPWIEVDGVWTSKSKVKVA